MTRTRATLLALAGLAAFALPVTAGVLTSAHTAPATSSPAAAGPRRVDLGLPITPPALSSTTAPVAPVVATSPTSAPQTAQAAAPAPITPVATPAPVATPPADTPTPPVLLGQPKPTGALACRGAETWDGTNCVAPQLPEEVIGRALTCDDGQTGYVIDADLDTNCDQPAPRTDPAG